MSGRFVQVLANEVRAYCERLGLSTREQLELHHFLSEADWRTGAVEGFDATRCAGELKLGGASGRRTLGNDIRRLEQLGVVEYTPARGGLPNGRLRLLPYSELVKARSTMPATPEQAGPAAPLPDPTNPGLATPLPDPTNPGAARVQRARRGPSPEPAARVQRARRPVSRARPARAALPENRLLPGDSPSEDNTLKTKPLAGRQESASADWQADELDELLAPILDFARRSSKTSVITKRADTAAKLAGYSRAEIQAAVRQYMLRVRVDGSIKNPFPNFLGLVAKHPEFVEAAVAGEAQRAARMAMGEDPDSGQITADPLAALRAARAAAKRTDKALS